MNRRVAEDTTNLARKRALPKPPPKISKEELYHYVLRCALLNTDAIGQAGMSVAGGQSQSPTRPQFSSDLTPSSNSYHPTSWNLSTSQKVNAFLSDFLQQTSSSSNDPTQTLSKDFLRKFRKRFSRIYEGKRNALSSSDPRIAYTLTNFVVTTMKSQAFKDRMSRNSTVAFLMSEFVNYAGEVGLLQSMIYVQVLAYESIDCLKYECVGIPHVTAMIKQFEDYLRAINTQTQPDANEPATIGSLPKHGGSNHRSSADIASSEPSEVYFHDRDGLVTWTRQVLGVSMEEHERTARSLRASCTPKVIIPTSCYCMNILT
jgi:hypothetical protein